MRNHAVQYAEQESTSDGTKELHRISQSSPVPPHVTVMLLLTISVLLAGVILTVVLPLIAMFLDVITILFLIPLVPVPLAVLSVFVLTVLLLAPFFASLLIAVVIFLMITVLLVLTLFLVLVLLLFPLLDARLVLAIGLPLSAPPGQLAFWKRFVPARTLYRYTCLQRGAGAGAGVWWTGQTGHMGISPTRSRQTQSRTYLVARLPPLDDAPLAQPTICRPGASY